MSNPIPEPSVDEILKELYSHHLSLVAYLLDGRAPDPKFSEKVMLSQTKSQLYKLLVSKKQRVYGVHSTEYFVPISAINDLFGEEKA